MAELLKATGIYLSDKYVHDCYKPLNKCNKSDQESIVKLLA